MQIFTIIPQDFREQPKEECDAVFFYSNVLAWDDPIHAIVTVEGTTITIEGMEGRFHLGVNEEMTGVSTLDSAGRRAVPYVSSLKITLH